MALFTFAVLKSFQEIFYIGEALAEISCQKEFYINNPSNDTASNNHFTLQNAEKCLSLGHMQLLYIRGIFELKFMGLEISLVD